MTGIVASGITQAMTNDGNIALENGDCKNRVEKKEVLWTKQNGDSRCYSPVLSISLCFALST